MPKFNTIKNSFLGGEISPRAMARTDLPFYNHSCEQLINMIPIPSGGAMRRPGTRYVKQTQGNNSAFLIPFVYSETEAYVVEITDGAIRIIRNNSARTVITPTLTGSSYYTPTYYAAANNLFNIQYCQSADVLFLVHPLYKPQKLIRTAANTFLFETFDNPVGGLNLYDQVPFRDANIDSTSTLTASAVSGSVTITSSAGIFNSSHVGAVFRLTVTTAGYVRVTGFTNSTTVTATVIGANLGGTTATSDWAEGSWSDYRGWPRSIAIFQSRMCYGGNSSQPDTLWCSKISNFNVMKQAVSSNADPCSFTLASNKVNQIQWLSPKEVLCIGTLGAEHVLVGADRSQAFGATNIAISLEQTQHGSRHVQPTRVGNSCLFVSKDGRKIREMTYDFYTQAYLAEDLSVYSDHITGQHISDFAQFSWFTQLHWDESYGVVWAVSADGALVSLTRDKTKNVNAWAQHRIGGHFDDAGYENTGAAVVSMCVIPDATGQFNEIWLSVVRTINGNDKFTIEYFGHDYLFNTVDRDDITTAEYACMYLDCSAFVNNGSPVKNVVAAAHLVGDSVSVVADGFYLGEQTVQAFGYVSTAVAATRFVAGYSYSSTIKTVRYDGGGAALGTAQGSIKRIDRAVVRFDRTIGASIGYRSDRLEQIKFRDQSDPTDEQVPLFTGDKPISFPGTYDRDAQVIIQQDTPFPMTVVGVTLHGEVNEVA